MLPSSAKAGGLQSAAGGKLPRKKVVGLFRHSPRIGQKFNFKQTVLKPPAINIMLGEDEIIRRYFQYLRHKLHQNGFQRFQQAHR